MQRAAVLAPVSPAGHYLTLRLVDAAAAPAALDRLVVDDATCVGLGAPLTGALGLDVPGLRAFPALTGPGVAVPSTQGAVWAWCRGADPGEALDRARAVVAALAPAFAVTEDVPAFVYQGGRDLTGYEDGTENPKDDAADAAAFAGPLTYVAAQRWVHDLGAMAAMSEIERDATIGRARASNEELADAPVSAHVKRSAQESYEPAAFMLRRSMPWGNATEHGLYFLAFGADLDRYERVMRRMVGLDDGVVDALFRFSRPVTGGYYVCPPLRGDRLDWRALG